MIAAAVLLTLLAGAAPVAGARGAPRQCTKPCTKMDCEDLLTISLRTASGRPVPSLVIEMDLDGESVTCAPAALGTSQPQPCDGRIAVTQQEIQHCRASGCQNTGRFEGLITITATPKRVRVRVKQGQRLLGERLFVSHYARVRPNGPGCPPVCRQARRIWQHRGP
jgi:hypothetical protein